MEVACGAVPEATPCWDVVVVVVVCDMSSSDTGSSWFDDQEVTRRDPKNGAREVLADLLGVGVKTAGATGRDGSTSLLDWVPMAEPIGGDSSPSVMPHRRDEDTEERRRNSTA